MAPMNANATLAAIAVKIVMVNAVVKRGENVFNAYMISSIRFNWLVGGCVGLARLGCSLSALLLSIVTNGVPRMGIGGHLAPASVAAFSRVHTPRQDVKKLKR